MGLYHSPKVATDGLVFMYDTGNSKSYPGEPTENVKPTGVAVGHNSGGYGNDVEVTDAPEKGAGWKKVTIKDRGSNFRIIQWTYTSMAANTMYCHSAVFDWGNMRDKGYYINHDGNGTGQRAFYLPGNYTSSQGSSLSISSSLPDGKIAGTITHTASHNHAFFINNSTTGLSGLNDYFYYKEFQVEVNTHPTQYTSGTRSATEGLIDRTGNSTIDLSNVSFDSNAQMVFDGTDDRMYTSETYNLGNYFTFEFVMKPNTLKNYGDPLGASLTDTSDYGMSFVTYADGHMAFNLGNGSSGWPSTAINTSAGYLTNGTYYHITGVCDAGSLKLYKNGVLTHSGTTPYTFNNYSINIGNRTRTSSFYPFNGNVDVVKAYDRALTASEVLKNFNAIRSRFGL